MMITTRFCLALAATSVAGTTLSQDLNMQILLPDPVLTGTSFGGYAHGKALLADPLPSPVGQPEYQSLFLGALADPSVTPTLYRLDPDPTASPAYSRFNVTPLDARFRFVTKLGFSDAEKALYAVGDVIQNPKSGSPEVWVVRRTPYATPGANNPWTDSDSVVLAKGAGASSRAQGMAVDKAGNLYVCGIANDSKGKRHFIVRRKSPGGGWSTVYDNVRSTRIPETGIAYFPGSPTAPAAVLMVGNEDNRWTILRSLTGNSGTWSPVDTAWSAANSPAGAKDITYDPATGKIYAVGYRGTFGSNASGWIVRVSTDGGERWDGLLDAPCPPYYSWADAVTTDGAGSVWVIGQVGVPQPDGFWAPQAHLVRCTDPANVLSWQSSFAGVSLPFDETNCSNSVGQAIVTDASGAVFVAGTVHDWVDSSTSPATKYPGPNVGLLRLTKTGP